MRRVCVFTGTRAEYGLLHWVLRELAERPDVELQLVVGGAHLSPEFGLTARAVAEDGFAVAARVEMLLSSDTPVGVAKSMGLGMIGMADVLDRLAPDLVVVLGDRFEAFAVAATAAVARVPIAHLHGGELTEGAVDDALRHAITKLAHLHLVAAEPFRRRVVRLGEDPARVHVVGAPGLDHLRRLDLLDGEALERALGRRLWRPTLLLTYHPETLGTDAFGALAAALDRFPDAAVVATRPNADAGGRALRAQLDAWAAGRAERVSVHTSLGQRVYLSLLAHADAVVGNSSSGLIEAPAAGTPTVDVGARQRGRPRAGSVLHCPADADAIAAAVGTALSPRLQALAARRESPYGDGRSAGRIAALLATADLDGLLVKRFHEPAEDREDVPAASVARRAPAAPA